MTERDEGLRSREHNLEEIASLGLPYLLNTFPGTVSSVRVIADFETVEGKDVRVAGRVMRVRLMGKAAFAHIQDRDGQLQLYIKLDAVGDTKFRYFKLLDIGDIVGIEGQVFRTRTGEVSVQVQELVLLAKAYRPLPEKWHGLTDIETRYRRRYLDLISNEDSRRIVKMRSAATRSIRHFLDSRGFIEVETPVLQPIYGGAAATPFVTQYQALDMDVYLRISDELYLKRLIVGGLERVYEIGKDFRNEGVSRKHSPEFTMLEFYQAYADYTEMMSLTETMVSAVILEVLGTQVLTFDAHTVDVSPPWRRLPIQEAIIDAVGVDIFSADARAELLKSADEHHVAVDPNGSRGKLTEELFSSLVEPTLIEPTFVIGHPVDFPGSLLAKRSPHNPDMAERCEPYLGGMELGNGFTELNDPFDQVRRMDEATRLHGEEFQQMDRDYILALEHGMPPTGGMGIGIDRLTMLMAGAHHMREVIAFPLLRPREDQNAES